MRRKDIVKWFKEEKGYGRIMLDGEDGNHVFVHFSAISHDKDRFSDNFRLLKQSQLVEFDLIENRNSADQVAQNVIIIQD